MATAFPKFSEFVAGILTKRIGGNPQLLEEVAVEIELEAKKAGFNIRGEYRDTAS